MKSEYRFEKHLASTRVLIGIPPLKPWERELEERLARLESRVEEMSKRLEEGLASVNKRIDDLRNDLNHRFQAVDKRMGDLKWEVRLWFMVLLALMTALAALKP